MPSTNLAQDTAVAAIKRQILAASVSVSEPPNTKSNRTVEGLVDDLIQLLSQTHPTETVKSSGPELESGTESVSSHNDEAEEPARAPSTTTAEEIKPFKFNLEGVSLESFSGPTYLTEQVASSEASIRSRLDSTSVFDFSAVRKGIFEISSEPKPATSGTSSTAQKQNSLTPNILLEETVKNLLQIPFDETQLDRILPLYAFEKLVEDPETCVSPTKKGWRCAKPIHIPRDGAPGILEDLAFLDAREDWEAVRSQLEDIIDMVLCASPHRREARKWLLTLHCRMTGRTSQCTDTESAGSPDALVMDAVVGWLKELCSNIDEKITELREYLDREEEQDDRKTARRKTTKWLKPPSTPDRQSKTARSSRSSTPTFSPYRPKGHEQYPLPLPQAIRKILQTPLSNQNLEAKYFYIFWTVGAFGYIKIGIANDVSQRLTDWRKCTHDIEERLQKPEPSASAGDGEQRVVANHAYRVEKLVQTELREVRVQHNCTVCAKRHVEWFATQAEHAAKVVKKYVDFMATRPYRFSEDSEKWVLDDGIEEEKVQEICEPIVVVQASSGSTRRQLFPHKPA